VVILNFPEILMIRTSGVKIEMLSSSFILPARTLHTHGATFTPREQGQLHIHGCVIKFSACKMREFPILGERSRRERESWYDTRGGESKTKRRGVVLPNSRTMAGDGSPRNHVEDGSFWPRKTVEATVLPPQPALVLEQSSLKDGCIMLLEGEM
jgi:Transport protein Trs120 or TRAPPC9, TRAPP II complex subunit